MTRRSLSERVLIAGVLLFLAPLGFVAATAAIEGTLARGTEQRVEACARAVADAWREAASLGEAAEHACRRHHLRVRVIEGDVVHEVADHLVSTSFDDLVGDVFYGPERSEVLRELERDQAPLTGRAETRRARETGDAMTCTLRPDANLRICSGALRATRDDGAHAIVHVIGSSRSAGASRYAQRRELAGMIVFGAALAVGLVAWLLRRVTGTVRDLASDVEALAASRDGRLHEERPRELAEVAAAFNRLRDTLARADAQNEAFLADLAHEMKNPVAAIAAAAESLEAESSVDPERRARLARSIGASASRLDRLIAQFLELARAEAGLPRDPRERVDLVALARGVASTTTVPDDRRLAIDAPEGALEVDGVPARLESALRNLVDNAIAFSRTEVRVRVAREEASLVLEVHDDGAGIAAADLPRVFERFYSARQDGRGTGLGLAIVRATVEAHGGRIEVRSRAGGGTTFAMCFSPR